MKKRLLTMMLAVVAVILPTNGWAQGTTAGDESAEAYAALDPTSGTTLTFYYDDQKAARGGMDIGPFEHYSERAWDNLGERITTVVFDDTFANYTGLTSTAFWFQNFSNLSAITGLSNLNTTNVTSMESMFNGCSSLESIDVSTFNTAHVTNMITMFYDCTSLTSLDLISFDTSNVTDMTALFSNCDKLTNLNINSFNTAEVRNMNGMFGGCSSLSSIDVSRFNTAKVNDMSSMFSGCSAVTSLEVGAFSTDNLMHMDATFAGCSSLTMLDLSSFNTENVRNMDGTFFRCSNLITIYVGNGWTTSSLESGSGSRMFDGCSSLVGGSGTTYSSDHVNADYAHIDGGENNPGYFTDKNAASSYREAYVVLMSNEGSGVSATLYYDTNKANHSEGFATVNLDEISQDDTWYKNRENIQTVTIDNTFIHFRPTSTANWFDDMSALTAITGMEYLNTEDVTDMSGMFWQCYSLTNVDVSRFNTANVTNMDYMFSNCESLTGVDVSGFNTENVTSMQCMFAQCRNLTSLDVSRFNTAKVTNMRAMFTAITGVTSLDLSSFNTANVTNMTTMFSGCPALATIYSGEGWSTASVTEGYGMFGGCSALVGGAGTVYNESYTDYTYAHIDGGENNPGYMTDKNAAPSSTVAAPVFTFEGDNLVMSTETQNASIFYKMEDVPDMSDTEVVESLMNNLTVTADGQQSTYYQQPIELTHNVIVKAIAVIDNETGTVTSEATSLAYNYEAWVNLMAAVERGNEVYERAKDNSNVQQESLENLQWALEEGNMIYAQRAEMPYFEAQHFAERINEICAEIEAQMNASSTPEPYALLTGDAESGMTMTFYYDGQKAARGGMDVGIYTQQTYTQRPWHDTAAEVTKVVIDPSFANYTDLTSTACWFFQFSKLSEIEGIENIKTENVTSFEWMFRECSSLTTLDLSTFNPAHLKTIEAMFYGCSGLTTIDINHFNTSEVTHWWGLFYGCSGLTSLDVSHLDTSSAEHFNSVFEGCSNLTSLDVSHFNTSKVVRMESLFAGCTKLKELDLRNFNTENVEHIYYMFRGCQNLTTLDLSSFNVSKVDDFDQMFAYCYALQNIVVSDLWQTTSATRGSYMFQSCNSLVGSAGTAYSSNMVDYTYAHVDGGTENPGYLTHRDAPQPYAVLTRDSNTGMTLTYYYDTQRYDRNGMSVGTLVQLWDAGTSTNNLLGRAWEDSIPSITTIVFDDSFANCTSLTNTSYWFYRYPNLMTIVGLTNLKTDNVTNMNSMFRNSYRLTSLDVSGFNTGKVIDMGYMFNGCFGLTALDLSSFNTENVTNMSGMFSNCEGLTSLNLSSFNTARLQVLQNIFYGCSSLTTLDLSSFNTENATDMHGMFQGCIRLETLDLTNFVTPKVRDFTNMFIGTALNTIYCNNDWDSSSLTNSGTSTNMFYGLTDLKGGNGTVYSEEHTGPEYARVDREGVPGYFTGKNAAPSGNAEPYAVLSDNNTVLTFYYDTEKSARGGMSVVPVNSESDIPWFRNSSSITEVVFDDSFANCTTITSTNFWFSECNNLVKITGMSNLNTSNVTTMLAMFQNCSSLSSIDLSHFDTSSSESLVGLFLGCSQLTSIDVSNFNTENTIAMQGMFNSCSSLTTLDLSNFNTAKVWDMAYMFRNCTALTTITVGSGWTTVLVTQDNGMFVGCPNLVGGAGTKYDENHIDVTYAHIDGGTANPGYFTDKNAPTEKVATPTFSWNDDNLTITTTTQDAEIFYSLSTPVTFSDFNNGSVSDFGWKLYRGSDVATCTLTEGPDGSQAVRLGNPQAREYYWDSQFAYILSDSLKVNTPYTLRFKARSSSADGVIQFWYENVPGYNHGGGWTQFNIGTDWAEYEVQFTISDTTYIDVNHLCLNFGSVVANYDIDDICLFEGTQYGTPARYASPVEVTSDVVILAWAEKAGMRTSLNAWLDYPYEAWNRLYGVCMYGVELTQKAARSPRVDEQMVREVEQMTMICYEMYMERTASREEVEDRTKMLLRFLGDLEQMMLVPAEYNYSTKVLTANEDATMAEIADYFGQYGYGNEVAAIVWNSSVAMTESDLQRFTSNPNLLIFATDATLVPANRNNVVINGVAENVVLTTTATGNCNFYSPQAFTANQISYTRTFSQQTEVGVSRGWETIALPFAVQTITHQTRGSITPFGNEDSSYHFWLRRMTSNGFQSVQTLEANVPYIISMPNSEQYPAEYNLAGNIVFSAENAEVPATTLVTDEWGEYTMTSTFQRLDAQESIYVLNVGEVRNGYPEGSIFERNYRATRPFEAYTTHRGSSPAPKFFMIGMPGDDGTTGIVTVGIASPNADTWYDLQGRKLQGKPTQKGVYIQNGKKITIK